MLAIDGKLYAGITRLYRLVVLNLLFVIGCLPIVTIGASFTALVSVIRSDERRLLTSFFQIYRHQIWSTLPYLFFNLMSVVFVHSLRMANTGASRFMYYVSLLFIFFILIYNLNLYVAHVLQPKMGAYQIFQSSFFLTIWSFYKTFWLPIMMGLAIWFLYRWLGLVILMVLFSLPIWLHVLLVRPDAERVMNYLTNIRQFNAHGK